MPTDRPDAAELIDAVREYLEQEAMPRLQGQAAFHARVAANALAIVARELADGPAADAAARRRLAALLGRDGPLPELEAELARLIRAGAFDHRRDELLAHLRLSAAERLAIANPRYLEQDDPRGEDPPR